MSPRSTLGFVRVSTPRVRRAAFLSTNPTHLEPLFSPLPSAAGVSPSGSAHSPRTGGEGRYSSEKYAQAQKEYEGWLSRKAEREAGIGLPHDGSAGGTGTAKDGFGQGSSSWQPREREPARFGYLYGANEAYPANLGKGSQSQTYQQSQGHGQVHGEDQAQLGYGAYAQPQIANHAYNHQVIDQAQTGLVGDASGITPRGQLGAHSTGKMAAMPLMDQTDQLGKMHGMEGHAGQDGMHMQDMYGGYGGVGSSGQWDPATYWWMMQQMQMAQMQQQMGYDGMGGGGGYMSMGGMPGMGGMGPGMGMGMTLPGNEVSPITSEESSDSSGSSGHGHGHGHGHVQGPGQGQGVGQGQLYGSGQIHGQAEAVEQAPYVSFRPARVYR